MDSEEYLHLARARARYYALRIPYSFINELHSSDFTSLIQPSDEKSVNEIVEAVGFDFIRTPDIEWEFSYQNGLGKFRIINFTSKTQIKGVLRKGGLETLSMVMLDLNYQNNVFQPELIFYSKDLAKKEWQTTFLKSNIGMKVMAIFIDIYGNEARELIDLSTDTEILGGH